MYTREELEKVNYIEKGVYIQNLMHEAEKGSSLTLAEETYLCRVVRVLMKPNSHELAYNILEVDYCKNFCFRTIYMLYFTDLEGYKTKSNPYGLIPAEEHKENVAFLHKEYLAWKTIIKGKEGENNLIGYISNETNKQLKEIKKHGDRTLAGSRLRDARAKSIILHGKLIYLVVKEYFQEQSSEELQLFINGNTIVINAYTYIHILFRHYSSAIKQYQTKSYHFDTLIDYKSLPSVLYEILSCYTKYVNGNNFNSEYIFFQHNGSDYALWFKHQQRSFKGGIKEDYLRLETFYPIEVARDIEKIKKLTLLKTDCGYDFYI